MAHSVEATYNNRFFSSISPYSMGENASVGNCSVAAALKLRVAATSVSNPPTRLL
jgi:hypothetical protein